MVCRKLCGILRYELFLKSLVFVITAALRQKFPMATETAANGIIGVYLAQSTDRNGGRKARQEMRSLSPVISSPLSVPDVDSDAVQFSCNAGAKFSL